MTTTTTQTRELEPFKLEHWPIQDVLAKLADAVDHLLRDHDCDMHGHEAISYAVVAARMHAAAPSDTEQVIRLREALEMMTCHGCGNRIGWTEPFTPGHGRTDWAKCSSCRVARAALRRKAETEHR